MNDEQLSNPRFALAIVACLVNRLGGSAKITQADFDQIAYCSLIEEGLIDGTYNLTLKQRSKQ